MNKKWVFIRYFAGLVIILFPYVLQSKDLKQTQPPEIQALKLEDRGSNEKLASSKITYIPPSLGKKIPYNGVSGGTRGYNSSAPLKLTLLSPTHVAQTTRAQPNLYWHISQDTQFPIMFTITEVNAVKPLVETQIQESVTIGFHTIQLKDYGIELQLGITYEWSISLINDTQNLYPSSGDVLEKAFLKRISPSPLTIKKLAQINSLNSLERARIYAENGIWYESLEMLMGKSPNAIKNQEILESRSELFEQVGLSIS